MTVWVKTKTKVPEFGQRVLGCWRSNDEPELDVAIYEGHWLDPDDRDREFAPPEYWTQLPDSPYAAKETE